MLELGIGFNPELTGRQNVRMMGHLLGFTPAEIDRLMPQIEQFAEIGSYIDQPLRTYSSGMQMRLAFSIATAKRPDLFIVDEALSVGDAYFQHKSFARIHSFCKEGTTLLVVSHDKETILSLCDHVILMDQGRILNQGTPQAMFDLYNALISDAKDLQIDQTVLQAGHTQTVSGSREATVENITLAPAIANELKQLPNTAWVGERVKLTLEIAIHQDIARLILGIAIKDASGQVMFGTNTFFTQDELHDLQAGDRPKVTFTFPMNIAPGSYFLTTALAGTHTHVEKNYEWKDLAYQFEVLASNTTTDGLVSCGNIRLKERVTLS